MNIIRVHRQNRCCERHVDDATAKFEVAESESDRESDVPGSPSSPRVVVRRVETGAEDSRRICGRETGLEISSLDPAQCCRISINRGVLAPRLQSNAEALDSADHEWRRRTDEVGGSSFPGERRIRQNSVRAPPSVERCGDRFRVGRRGLSGFAKRVERGIDAFPAMERW